MTTNTDNQELEDLFDSIVKQSSTAEKPVTVEQSKENHDCDCESEGERNTKVFNRVGHLVRNLHDTLGEIRTSGKNSENIIRKVSESLPDTKDRLAYIYALTEQAANRVLNATDIINPLLEEVGDSSRDLGMRWDKAFAGQLSIEEFKLLAKETRSFFKHDTQAKLGSAHNQLTEIMMAQDFQDLTGQVIKKIVTLLQEIESGLMAVLIDSVPDEMRTEQINKLSETLNGPVINSNGSPDVVVNQQEVDDLLGSLGF